MTTDEERKKLEALGELALTSATLALKVNTTRRIARAVANQERAVRKAGKAVLGRTPSVAECLLIDPDYQGGGQ